MSYFDHVPTAPVDPILGINTAFLADTNPNKVNLGVGAYRTEEGKPLILSVVKKVEKQLAESQAFNKEYLPIEGLADFNRLSAALMLGKDHPAFVEKRVATVQSLSGTGALRIGGVFLKRFLPEGTAVYLSKPTWENHVNVFRDSGFDVHFYRYYKPDTNGLDFHGMIEDLKNAPNGSIILLHVCAHNPTGVDPSYDQWKSIAEVILAKRHFPFFDSAYQGFASGDLQRDAASVRLFVDLGIELLFTQSYAKNFGLYGERIGALSAVVNKEAVADAIKSQLKAIIRPMYSSPPTHGARIVATVLGDPELFQEWNVELKIMSGRINDMRQKLYNALIALKTPGDWRHILNQIGMFTFTGLTEAQVEVLTQQYHIYLVKTGRISMAGLNSGNVEYVAKAIHDAVTNKSKV